MAADALSSLEVSAISSVAGVFNGALPTSDIQVNGFLGSPPIVRGSGTLFAPLTEPNTSSIDLSNSRLYHYSISYLEKMLIM